MTFFREHKLLVILLVLSVLVLAVGLVLVNKSNREYDKQQQQINQLNNIALDANQTLLQTLVDTDVPIADVAPEKSIERVKAMNGVIPEAGTDDWCEYMMVKEADTWTMDERSIFAQHCI